MTARLAIPILALFLFAGTIAGCSGGNDESSGSAGGSGDGEGSTANVKTWNGSKQAFIAKADAICTKQGQQVYQGVLKAIYPAGIDGAKAPELKKAVETALAPGLEAEIREIRALGFPSGDEEEVEAILGTLEEQIDRARSEPATFLVERDPLDEAEKPAEAYGFKICGGVA